LIAHISGKLIQKQPNSIIVDVGGVGYELNVPLSTFYDLGEIGGSVSLRVHTHVREDALQLFGFRTEAEKKLFLLLNSVSGIGPKLAITVLSGLSAEELIQAIRAGNLVKLTAIPGVGKKTAERMLVELKDKVAAILPPGLEDSTTNVMAQTGDPMREDVISALVNLGYQRSQAEKAVNAVLKQMPDARFEALLKSALRSLAI
jgi:Holliday junction DNA helicase RuvA